ncbi:MAG: C10 family peptidase [Paludibacteraceae bacterium]|nr:C10 family peptidase [Paludibacteraceae bacterium]
MKRIYLLPFMAMGLVACDDEVKDSISKSEMQEFDDELLCVAPALYSTNHTISPHKAESAALNLVKCVKNEKGLKSEKNLSVESIHVVERKKGGLKSINKTSDTLAYVVNFSNNTGYAYVCADDRVANNVLAFFDEGKYGDADNRNLDYMLEQANIYIENSINKFEANKEVLREYVECKKAGSNKGLKSTSVTLYRSISPLIKTKWGQGYPYNNKIQCKRCGKWGYCLAGCANTALGQILNYWKWPTNISVSGTYVDWNKINSTDITISNNEIKRLMFALAEDNKTKSFCYPGCTSLGSATAMSDVDNTVKRYGYETYSQDFSTNFAVSWIDLGIPILINAYTNDNIGHVWIIDGYETYAVTVNNQKTYSTYLHNNWGWDGDCNGYFYSGVFDTRDPLSYDEAKNTRNCYFSKNIKIRYIYPGMDAWFLKDITNSSTISGCRSRGSSSGGRGNERSPRTVNKR